MSLMLSTGCDPIDTLLGGGIENGVVTQVYGEAGSGKTNLCIQTAVECIRAGLKAAQAAYDDLEQSLASLPEDRKSGRISEYASSLGLSGSDGDDLLLSIRRKLRSDMTKKVVYIDTEGLSHVRFGQIAGAAGKEIAQNIIIYEPMDLDEQYTAIRDIEKIAHLNIGLVIIDSATAYYRYGLDDDLSGIQSRRELTNQIGFLHNLARKHGFAALITNQVFSDVSGGASIRAIGGKAIEHISKTILFLEKTGTGERKATVVKHRSLPEGKECRFLITENGLR